MPTLCTQHPLADPGGRAPPTGSNSFVFAYVFAKKHPRRRLAPPQREILDPPLITPNRRDWNRISIHELKFSIIVHITFRFFGGIVLKYPRKVVRKGLYSRTVRAVVKSEWMFKGKLTNLMTFQKHAPTRRERVSINEV